MSERDNPENVTNDYIQLHYFNQHVKGWLSVNPTPFPIFFFLFGSFLHGYNPMCHILIKTCGSVYLRAKQ